MKNNVSTKKFMGKEVRVVNDEYVVLKDMFGALGRLRSDGQIESTDRRKIKNFMDMSIVCAGETFTITSKSNKSKSRETQDVECIRIEDTSILFTQFEPTSRAGQEAHDTWIEFMKFVKDLLIANDVHKYIFADKKYQTNCHEKIDELDGKPVIMNVAVARIMGKICGISEPLYKKDLTLYQDKTTIDLLEAHRFVTDKFINAYEFTDSHKAAEEMALKLAIKKFGLDK